MDITITEQNGKLVAVFDGYLDTAASYNIEMALKPLYECTDKDIILDCENMKYISSAGLRQFLTILKHSKQHGRKVYIKDMKEEVYTSLVITGFSNIFKFI